MQNGKPKYRPKYNPYLDAAFPLRSRNPIRYGLTAEQMEYLFTSGQWKIFKDNWDKQRLRYHNKTEFSCMLCGSNRRDNIKILNKRLCLDCCSDIREIVCRQRS